MENVKKLDNAQLLNLIKDTDKEVEDIHVLNDDISNFLSFYNINPGNEKVSKRTLFKLYKAWTTAVKSYKLTGFVQQLLRKQFEVDYNKIFIDKNQINIDVLILKKLETKPKKPRDRSDRYRERFERFLNEYDIKSGNTWVKSKSLYDLQKKYFPKHCFTPQIFSKLLKLYIKEHDYVNRCLYFRVDDSIIKHLENGHEKEEIKIPKKKC